MIITCQGSRCPSTWKFPCTSSCPYHQCSAQQSPPFLMTLSSNPLEPPCLAGGLHESCSRPNASWVCSPCSGPSTISRCEPAVGCRVTATWNNNNYTCCITLVSWEVISIKCMYTRINCYVNIYKNHPIATTHRTWGWTAFGPPQLKMLRMVKRKAGWNSARDPEGCSILQTPPSDVARSTKRHVLETGWAYEIDWICSTCTAVIKHSWWTTIMNWNIYYHFRSLVWQFFPTWLIMIAYIYIFGKHFTVIYTKLNATNAPHNCWTT